MKHQLPYGVKFEYDFYFEQLIPSQKGLAKEYTLQMAQYISIGI